MFDQTRLMAQVHNRIWDCGGSSERVSCNCGFVVREDNDVIAVDMCDRTNELETEAQIRIKSPPPVSSGVKIKQARNGTKITVSQVLTKCNLCSTIVLQVHGRMNTPFSNT